MASVLVPLTSGMLSALGLAAADLRRDYVGGSFEEMEAAAARDLPGAAAQRLVDARYRGQSHELTVDAERWEDDLAEAHERRYGFRLDAEPEIVTRRLVATLPRERPSLQCRAPSSPPTAAAAHSSTRQWLQVRHGPDRPSPARRSSSSRCDLLRPRRLGGRARCRRNPRPGANVDR
jgi:N-methylhydantoinase A